MWFGEAKFYKKVDKAMSSAIDSINRFLRDKEAIKKENSIITSLNEINEMDLSDNLVTKIKDTLSFKNSLDNIKTKLNIPILLLHQCDITAPETELTDEYKKKVSSFHKEKATKYFEKQIYEMSDIIKYADIKFHLMLFPIPDKNKIVRSFNDSIKYFKRQ